MIIALSATLIWHADLFSLKYDGCVSIHLKITGGRL